MNAKLLEVAIERGITSTLRLLALSEQIGVPLHVPADRSAKRRAAGLLQQLLGRPEMERRNG